MRIGIDIGGSKIAAGLVDMSGKVTARRKVLIGRVRRYPVVRDAILDLVDQIRSKWSGHKESIDRIGIACAGQIDCATGNILFSPNLGWRNAPLCRDVEKGCSIETFIENDVNAAIYGEWKFALHGSCPYVLGVYLGTGVGGGIIIDGKVYRGFLHVGGEVGHMTLNPDGYLCNCGNRGCFEAYCGGAYIVDRVKKRLSSGYRGKIWELIDGDIDALHAGHVEEGAMLNDDLCNTVWKETLEYLGAGLASLANVLNPGIIILGGGVVYGTRRLIDDVKPIMEKRAMAPSVKNMKVIGARLKEDAAIMGAAFSEQ